MLDELDPMELNDEKFNTSDKFLTLREIYDTCIKLKPTVLVMSESLQSDSNVHDTLECLNKVTELYYNAVVVKKLPIPLKNLQPSMESMDHSLDQSKLMSGNLLDVAGGIVNDNYNNAVASITTIDLNDKTFASESTISELQMIFSSQMMKPQINVLTPQTSNVNEDIISLIKSHKSSSPDDLIEIGNLGLVGLTKSSILTESSDTDKKFDSISDIVSDIKMKLLSGVEDVPKTVNDSDDANNQDEDNNQMKVIDKTSKEHQHEMKIALKDIKFDINLIEPSETEPQTILNENNGLKIIANVTKDYVAKDVRAIVVTVSNFGPQEINNFQLDASVSKPCKLAIKPSSGNRLASLKNKFKPPETIDVILLLLNPTKSPVNVITIISYYQGDDIDACKEALEIKNISF
jgi:hypothetical protein